jgi:hypothetical protein
MAVMQQARASVIQEPVYEIAIEYADPAANRRVVVLGTEDCDQLVEALRSREEQRFTPDPSHPFVPATVIYVHRVSGPVPASWLVRLGRFWWTSPKLVFDLEHGVVVYQWDSTYENRREVIHAKRVWPMPL